MASRNNVQSMMTTDAYGNPTAPRGLSNRPKKGLLLNKNNPGLSRGYGGSATTDAMYRTSGLTEMEKPEKFKTKFDAIGATGRGINTGIETYKSSQGDRANQSIGNSSLPGKDEGSTGNTSSLKTGQKAAAVNAAAAGLGQFGKELGAVKSSNGKEDAGGALKGASRGFAAGSAIGSLIPIPGIGTFVGGAIGAGVGAIAGAIGGKKKMKKRKAEEAKAETERLAYNKNIQGIKRREIGKGADIDSYKRLLSAAGQYSNGGKIKFQKGGILKYSTLNVREGMSYLNSLVEPEEKAPSKIFRLEKGGTVKLKPLKVPKIPKKMYKKGGKVSKGHSGCGCTSCMKSMKSGGTPKFRRGGKLDVAKQNVILDGPSHDQKNNTGVAGDKGLPIVKNGEKVAEIESNELVLNADAVKKIDALKEKIESGDSQAKKDLADLLHKELGENTYDYNKSL